jgi:hypothetical protein
VTGAAQPSMTPSLHWLTEHGFANWRHWPALSARWGAPGWTAANCKGWAAELAPYTRWRAPCSGTTIPASQPRLIVCSSPAQGWRLVVPAVSALQPVLTCELASLICRRDAPPHPRLCRKIDPAPACPQRAPWLWPTSWPARFQRRLRRRGPGPGAWADRRLHCPRCLPTYLARTCRRSHTAPSTHGRQQPQHNAAGPGPPTGARGPADAPTHLQRHPAAEDG